MINFQAGKGRNRPNVNEERVRRCLFFGHPLCSILKEIGGQRNRLNQWNVGIHLTDRAQTHEVRAANLHSHFLGGHRGKVIAWSRLSDPTPRTLAWSSDRLRDNRMDVATPAQALLNYQPGWCFGIDVITFAVYPLFRISRVSTLVSNITGDRLVTTITDYVTNQIMITKVPMKSFEVYNSVSM